MEKEHLFTSKNTVLFLKMTKYSQYEINERNLICQIKIKIGT